MPEWLFVIPAAIIPVALLLLGVQKKARDSEWKQIVPAWRDAARRLDFRFGPGEHSGLIKMYGRMAGLDVVVDTSNDLRLNTPLVEVTRFQVFSGGGIPENISIERVQPDGVQMATRWKHVETGDLELDQSVVVSGSEAIASALLDSTRRKLLLGWVGRSGAVVESSNIFYMESGHLKDAGLLVDRVERLVRFARAMCMPESAIPSRLLENARTEENVFIRRRAFRTLFLDYAGTPEAEAAVAIGLADLDARIRLYAAMSMGERGVPVIEEIAFLPATDLEDRRYAFDHLVRVLPAKQADFLIRTTLPGALAEIQRTIVRAVRDARRVELAGALAATPLRRLDEETACVLGESLGLLGSSDAEELLLAMLTGQRFVLKKIAAHALGRVGTVRSVEHLLELTKVFTPAELKDAARAAVKHIQARIADADAGRLSLVDPQQQQGSLSLAADGGALSVASEGGALSLAHEAGAPNPVAKSGDG